MTKQVQTPVIWGLSREKWREIVAFLLFLLAVLILLSLVGYDAERSWIGSLGNVFAFALHWLVGKWVSYVLPVLLLLAAFHAFKGQLPFYPLRKTVAGILIVLSLCALLTVPCALSEDLQDSEMSFQLGGMIGNFLTNPRGLGMAYWCGPVGSFVICIAGLLMGVMLSTDFLFLPLIRTGARSVRSLVAGWRKGPPVATLRFERQMGSRVFPITTGEKRAEAHHERGDGAAAERRDAYDDEEPEETDQPSPRSPAARQKKEKTAAERGVQTELDFTTEEFQLPSLDLLSDTPRVAETDPEEVVQVSNELEQALADFNISARVVAVTQGPVVTRYELQPAPGIKVSRIMSLESDIALVLRAKSVRIQAPIPGKAAVGIEVPNRKVSAVYFKELIATEEFRNHPSNLAFALGKNISGEPIICDLAEMPHLLIAGTTGSGKSVCINVIISSILYRMPPDKVKLIMIDPKRVELNVYSDIPYLLAPVVNEPRQAAAALAWAIGQMEERLQLFSELKVRNITSYNALVTGPRAPGRTPVLSGLKPLSHIVIIIDELADLMLIARNEVEDFVIRLAQMSRAAGIHMIIATQRPSVNVITGIIKANFSSRIAFRVSAKVDSRTILDMNGAETLLGRGDMLFSPGGIKPMRIQGAFISDADVEQLTNYLRAQNRPAYEHEEFPTPAAASISVDSEDDRDSETDAETDASGVGERAPTPERPRMPAAAPPRPFPSAAQPLAEFPAVPMRDDMESDEELYDRALRMVLENRKPSVSMIQRRLKVGFARAGRLMDLMEERGIVGSYQGSKPRELLIEPEEYLRRLDEIERDKNRRT